MCFLATSDVALSLLAVERSDVPYVLKLASGDSSVRAEMGQFTSPQLSLQSFHLVANLWCKLDLRVTDNDNKQNEM